VSEELAFLLTAYAALQRDPRIGRIEAATGHGESFALAQMLHPDVVVLDVTAGDSGQSMIGRLRHMDADLVVIVTFREYDQEAIAAVASTLGAHDVCPREAFSADRVVRATQALAAQHQAARAAATPGKTTAVGG
jgi:DNA-binding NarL/FixJ family response regulator